MKGCLSIVAIGLLVSFVTLFGAQPSEGPKPLTEAEQEALIQKMGLPAMENPTDTQNMGSAGSEEM